MVRRGCRRATRAPGSISRPLPEPVNSRKCARSRLQRTSMPPRPSFTRAAARPSCRHMWIGAKRRACCRSAMATTSSCASCGRWPTWSNPTMDVQKGKAALTLDNVTDWWETEITDIAPGTILVRGYAIQDLIGRVGFSEMIWLTLRGELPTAGQIRLFEAVLVSAVDHGPQ